MATLAPKLTEVKSEVFFEIPLDMIIVEEQIRTEINMEGESFLGLKASIAENGVLEPVLVTPLGDGKYLMISGELRYLACRDLGMTRIPARVLDAIEAKAEILAIQLTENLQREDLDPIDTANAMFSYFKARNNEMELAALVNLLVLYQVDPLRVNEADVSTLDTLTKASGKSVSSIKRMLSLLTLPEVMKKAVKKGDLPVSHGYILAANLDNPGLQEAFNRCIETPMTFLELERLLASFKKVKQETGTTPVKKKPFAGLYLSMRNTKISLAKGGSYQQADLEKLRDDLNALAVLIDQRIQALAGQAGGA